MFAGKIGVSFKTNQGSTEVILQSITITKILILVMATGMKIVVGIPNWFGN